ncbi:GntR family transcriptional regulator [Streptomyces diastatochromogenes]|nr:GntR family transcriptional regulator [Streptomyces diastatochromogenes]
MPLEWSGLSPELLLVVDRDRGGPLRSQLELGLRDAIRTGRLGVGERLPSSRELARVLGVSRGLVQECYAQLQAEGYLVTRVGSATRVATGAGTPPAPPSPPPAPSRLTADFTWGVPDLAGFPLADWLWAMREGHAPCRRRRSDTEIRAAVRSCARSSPGICGGCAAAADPERTVICSGYAQGLGLALRALAGTGVRTVAYEDPGSPAAVSSAAASAGMSAVPVPVDELGVDVRALAATGARAVVVTPPTSGPPASPWHRSGGSR